MSFISCGCAHENLNPCFIWAFMKMRLSRHIQLLRIEQIKISSARGQAKKLMTKGRKDATRASSDFFFCLLRSRQIGNQSFFMAFCTKFAERPIVRHFANFLALTLDKMAT